MRIMLAGGTGVVGKELLRQSRARGDHLIAVGRRPHRLADEELIIDFNALPQLPTADVAICALGTTIKTAGSATPSERWIMVLFWLMQRRRSKPVSSILWW